MFENYVSLDLETTGLSPSYAEIIEIGAVKVRGGAVVDTYQAFVKPAEMFGTDIEALTGISWDMVKTAPSIDDIVGGFLAFIGDDIVVGHNIVFDLRFLKAAYPALDVSYIDTMYLSQKCLKSLENYKLRTVCAALGVKNEQAHRALSDSRAAQEVFEKLKAEYQAEPNPAKVTDWENNPPRIRSASPQPREIIETDKMPEDMIDVNGLKICITGEFALGDRSDVEKKLTDLGAELTGSVSGKTDFLIVGNKGSATWKNGSYGGKIAKALDQQAKGKKVQIVNETDFFSRIKE